MSEAVQSYVPAVTGDNSGFNSYSPPAATVATVTAGSSIVTFSAGAFTTNTQAERWTVHRHHRLANVEHAEHLYRHVLPQNATTIKVDPIPTKSFTATQGTGTGAFVRAW
jgi:hypothetical protein